MYFDGRELKSYAEHVCSSDLKQGATYYALLYVDSEMLTPMIETLVFIGKNLEPDDIDQAYFQDLNSFQQGVTYNWETEDAAGTFYSGPSDALNHIFTYEELLNELMKCSLRRAASRRTLEPPKSK
jgi:hypothetical protein